MKQLDCDLRENDLSGICRELVRAEKMLSMNTLEVLLINQMSHSAETYPTGEVSSLKHPRLGRRSPQSRLGWRSVVVLMQNFSTFEQFEAPMDRLQLLPNVSNVSQCPNTPYCRCLKAPIPLVSSEKSAIWNLLSQARMQSILLKTQREIAIMRLSPL